MLDDGADEGREVWRVAKNALVHGVKNFPQLRVELVLAVVVGVAQFFHIFCQIPKQEDVLVAGFSGNFDLSIVSNNQTQRYIGR